MNKTKIDWGYDNLYTYNPIVGCQRNCYYCYARIIYNRFNKTSFSSIIEYPDRFNDPGLSSKKPRTIFVGSMSDIEYWTKEQLQRVVDICREYQKHTFMFLSKSPVSYKNINIPANVMCGYTVEKADQHSENDFINYHFKYNPRPFLSIEPLLGLFTKRIPDFEKIVVGAMTGPGARVPKKEWIQSILDNIDKDKIYWKQSIRLHLNKMGYYSNS
jgi:protein gp37